MAEKIKFLPAGKSIVVLLLLILIGLAFYWFQWRPAQIRSQCIKLAKSYKIEGDKSLSFEQSQKLQEVIQDDYANCLYEHGLKN